MGGNEALVTQTIRAVKRTTNLGLNTAVHRSKPLSRAGVLERMFEVLEERYIRRDGRRSWHFLPKPVEEALEGEEDMNHRARLVCDWLANLTDRSAWERHQRLFDVSAGAMGKFL